MSSFGAKGLTNKGRVLQAKAQVGVQLKYTKYVLGDAQLGGQSIATLPNVISPKKTVDVTRLKMTPPNQATVGFVLSNQDVTTGFYFRELGLYAMDPDDGEILYWYANAGDTADYIPPTNTGDVISKTIDMLVYVGTASNVTLTIDQNLAYVTHDELEEALAGLDPDIPNASLTEKGIVQLSNATNGTRENVAPTEKALGEVMKEALAGKQLGVEQKANVVAALNSIGVPASTSESWAQLIPKIAAVIRATGNATAADLLAGKTASNANGPFTGNMPNRSAENEHMPGLESTVWAGDRFFIRPPHGYFNGSTWVTAAVPGLTANNLRAGVNVAGLLGTLIEGKPFASGSAIVKDRIEFSVYGGGVRDTAYIEVNGLAFVPKRIVVYAGFVSALYIAETGMVGILQNAWNNGYSDYFIYNALYTSFRIPVSSKSSSTVGSTVYWEVYG